MASRLAEHLTVYRNAWADRYEGWAAAWASRKDLGELGKMNSVLYGGAASAFRLATASGLMSPQTGYVDLANLERVYIVSAMKNYTRKRHIAEVKYKKINANDAHAIAVEFDRILKPAILFADVEVFARERLAMLSADITGGSGKPIVVGGEEPSAPKPPDPPVEEKKAAAAPAIDLAALFAWMNKPVDTGATAKKVLSTYPDERIAEIHAKANGYANFAAAYAALGQGARYDDETAYTSKGMMAENVSGAAPAGDAIF